MEWTLFWTAATLGSGSKISTGTVDAEDSICPRGWKMPSRADGDSWQNLFYTTYEVTNNTHGYNRVNRWPLNYMPTGLYNDSGSYSGYASGRTTYGYWWSISGYSTRYSFHLSVQIGGIIAQNFVRRGTGYAIRCVVRS